MESIKALVFNTLYQFWWLVGVMAAMGLVLYLLARIARVNYSLAAGSKFDTYFTGWIGTPVHEFGHWVFCLIFMHKVKEVRFFKPDPKSGTLGFVSHSYNKKSIYQNIGNFFIGIGPLLVGGGVLMVLAYFMLPSHVRIVNLFNDFTQSWPIEVSYGWKSGLVAIADNLWVFIKLLVVKGNLHAPIFWLFIYISLCISSHMMLSVSDIKTAGLGALTFIAILLLVNVASELVSLFAKNSLQFTISNRVGLFSLKFGASVIFLLSFSCVLSLVSVLFSALLRGLARVLGR